MRKNCIKVLTLSATLLVVGSTFGLTSCSKEVPIELPEPATSFTFKDKESYSAEWKIGEADRLLEFDFGGKEINTLSAYKEGKLKVFSSNEEIVTCLGFNARAVSAGEATVFAVYNNEVGDGNGKLLMDSFKVTVKESDKEMAPTPATVAEFIAVENKTNVQYLVTGTIDRWNDKATDGGKYGNFYLKSGDAEVLIYGSTVTNTAFAFADGKWTFTNPKTYLDNAWSSALKLGDEVTMLLTRCDYGSKIEGNGVFVAGPNKLRVEATEDTLDNIMDDTYFGKSSWTRVYKTKATILGFGSKKDSLTDNVADAKEYGNMFVKTESGEEVQVYGASASDVITYGETSYGYSNKKDFQTNEITSALKVGDTIEFECIRADYGDIKEISIDRVKLVA